MTTASRSLTTALLRGALARGLLRRVTPPAGTRPGRSKRERAYSEIKEIIVWILGHSVISIFFVGVAEPALPDLKAPNGPNDQGPRTKL